MVLLVGSRYLCLVEIMLLARCEGGCCGDFFVHRTVRSNSSVFRIIPPGISSIQ